MKRIVMIALMVTVSMPCFASKTHSVDIYISTAVRVGAKILPDGKYNMRWVESGTGAQVSFFRYSDPDNSMFTENKPSVTVHATLTPADNQKTITSSGDPGLIEAQSGGMSVLNAVEMPHLTVAFSGVPAD